eukprot:4492776-Amphidinium_carterae.1
MQELGWIASPWIVCMCDGLVQIKYTPTKLQLADGMTKGGRGRSATIKLGCLRAGLAGSRRGLSWEEETRYRTPLECSARRQLKLDGQSQKEERKAVLNAALGVSTNFHPLVTTVLEPKGSQCSKLTKPDDSQQHYRCCVDTLGPQPEKRIPSVFQSQKLSSASVSTTFTAVARG